MASPASSARRSRGRPRLLRSPPRPGRLLCLPPRPAPRAVAPASAARRRHPGLLRPSPSPSPWPSPSRPPITEPRRRKRGWTRPLDFGGRVGPGSEPNIPSGSDPTPSNLHPNIRKRGATHPGWTLPFNQIHGNKPAPGIQLVVLMQCRSSVHVFWPSARLHITQGRPDQAGGRRLDSASQLLY